MEFDPIPIGSCSQENQSIYQQLFKLRRFSKALPYEVTHAAKISGLPMGPHPHGQGVPSSPATGTPLSMETPHSDRGLIKKLKVFEGLAMSIGNGHIDSTKLRTENKLSQRIGESFPALGRSAIYLKESHINALPRLEFSFGYDIS
ncbi:G-box-binding factor [Arachis hypogaea]|uniref:G-box-binding factor n=1 Tax=Arachis hypogaea TaxID=3818 RepID=A0A444XPL4_ARAHY|nr:G-box-binding factor [Arachis hypogaea]RYQ91643.1 hypothetical protein Ahy_B09g097630 [Arachis hypogaea]